MGDGAGRAPSAAAVEPQEKTKHGAVAVDKARGHKPKNGKAMQIWAARNRTNELGLRRANWKNRQNATEIGCGWPQSCSNSRGGRAPKNANHGAAATDTNPEKRQNDTNNAETGCAKLSK